MTTAILHLQATMEREKIITLHMRFGTEAILRAISRPDLETLRRAPVCGTLKITLNICGRSAFKDKFTRKLQTLRCGV